jgi:hypothetical protein
MRATKLRLLLSGRHPHSFLRASSSSLTVRLCACARVSRVQSDAITAASIPDLSLSKDDAKKYGYWLISRYLASKEPWEGT